MLKSNRSRDAVIFKYLKGVKWLLGFLYIAEILWSDIMAAEMKYFMQSYSIFLWFSSMSVNSWTLFTEKIQLIHLQADIKLFSKLKSNIGNLEEYAYY